MGLLERLFGGKTRSFSFSFPRETPDDSSEMSVSVEGDWVVLRMNEPDIDPSTITFESHIGMLHVKGAGTTVEGQEVKLYKILHASGGDESRAQVTKEGDELVVRMPRD